MPRDLHALTRELGTQAVADLLAMAHDDLKRARCGATAITVDELHTLAEAFQDFDLVGTVRRIGARRHEQGRSKRARRAAAAVTYDAIADALEGRR